jgi:hypothetical protein
MAQRYVLSVALTEDGVVAKVRAHDNEALVSFNVRLSKAPEFVAERIALLKLTTVNKTGKEGPLGFKLNDYDLTVFITHDEFNQLRGECK